MSNLKIPIYKPYLNGNEKKYVNQVIDSTWISSKGHFIETFEQAFAEYIGVNYATSVTNGTVALHLALLALDLKPDDEIIIPTLTYIASANAAKYIGAKVVFADSLSDTWQVDPLSIKNKITAKTKAIMPVHLYGHMCDMDAISKIAKSHNLLVIEDAAEAFGSRCYNQHAGTCSDIATFSFFGNKTITTGEGGMIVTNNKDYYDFCKKVKSQGLSGKQEYWHDIIAYNYRMTNICAAIGLAQLEQADEIIAKKREIASQYQALLVDLPLKLHKESVNYFHSYWMCSIALDDEQKREPLRDFLRNCGIETRPVFYPVHTMDMYFEHLNYPVAQSIASRGINLPSWPGLTEKEIGFICDKIKDFFLKAV